MYVIDLMAVCDWFHASVSEWERSAGSPGRTEAFGARERGRETEREKNSERKRERKRGKKRDALIILFCKGGTCCAHLPLVCERPRRTPH